MKSGVLCFASSELGDDERFVHGIVNRFDVEILTSLDRTGKRLAWVTFRRGSLDRHLARLADPSEIPIDVDHETGPVGRLNLLVLTGTELRVIGEIYDCPGGDLALEGSLDGRLRGFSVEFRILQSEVVGQRDYPVVVVTEAELVAASLCPDPADDMCKITRACDIVPEWRLREEAEARDVLLHEMLKRQPRVARYAIEPSWAWGRGFGPR